MSAPSMTRDDRSTRPLALIALLALVACGPPKASDGGDDEGTSTDAETTTDATTSTSAGTSSSSSDSSETDTSDDDGLPTTGFVPEDDLICDCSVCDVFAQDCPEGEKCVPYPSSGGPVPDANKCAIVFGEQPPGQPCSMPDPVSANDDCDQSSICWDRLDGEHGTCRAFCTGTADNPVCAPGEVCFFAYEGSLNVCVPGCDPLLQDCEAGFGCYWTGSVFACSVTSTGVEVGEPCGFIDDCNPGLMCVGEAEVPGCMGTACCTPYCDTSFGDADCAALPGTTCQEFFEQGTVPPPLQYLGVCWSLQP